MIHQATHTFISYGKEPFMQKEDLGQTSSTLDMTRLDELSSIMEEKG